MQNGTLEDTGDFSAETSVSGGTALALVGGTLQLHQGNVTTATPGGTAWGIVVEGGELKNAVVPASNTIEGTSSGGTLSNVTIDGTLNLDQQDGTTLTVADVLTLGDGARVLVGNTGQSSPDSATLDFTTESDSFVEIAGAPSSIIFGDGFNNRLDIEGSYTLQIDPAISIIGGRGVLFGVQGSTYDIAGTLSAEASGQTIYIYDNWTADDTTFADSPATIQVKNGGGITTFYLPSNYDSSSGTLTGGTWNAIGSGSNMSIAGMDVAINDATVLLDGGGVITQDTIPGGSQADALTDLATNDGTLTVQNGETLTVADEFTNDGNLTVDGSGSVLTAANSFMQAGGTLAVTHGGQIASDAVSIGGGDFDLTGTPFEAGAGRPRRR